MVRGVGPPPTPPPPNQVEPPAVMLKPEPEADLVHPPTVLHVFPNLHRHVRAMAAALVAGRLFNLPARRLWDHSPH